MYNNWWIKKKYIIYIYIIVATLIEAFGNNFNDNEKCNNCDSRKYRVESCVALNNNQSLCNDALAQDPSLGTSQNCEYNNGYCSNEHGITCSTGMQRNISPNCKLRSKGGYLKNPICTGRQLHTTDGYFCLNPPIEQNLIRSFEPIQNYYCDENNQNCKFCEWIDQDNQSTTQIDCEPKPK